MYHRANNTRETAKNTRGEGGEGRRRKRERERRGEDRAKDDRPEGYVSRALHDSIPFSLSPPPPPFSRRNHHLVTLFITY